MASQYRVVDYYDLRPVDWASGKHMPLEPGEGHICDRCEAEHALVYVVEDTSSGKCYRVGSGCAKKSFGFDLEKDDKAKELVKGRKAEAEEAVNNERLEQARNLARLITDEVRRTPQPKVVLEREVPSRYPHFPGQLIRVYRAGDVEVESWQSSEGTWNVREAEILASHRWLSQEIQSRIPDAWKKISAYPNSHRKRQTQDLFELTSSLVWKQLDVR